MKFYFTVCSFLSLFRCGNYLSTAKWSVILVSSATSLVKTILLGDFPIFWIVLSGGCQEPYTWLLYCMLTRPGALYVRLAAYKSSESSCLLGNISLVTWTHSRAFLTCVKLNLERLSWIHFEKSCLSSTWQVYIAGEFLWLVGWSSDSKGIKCCTTNQNMLHCAEAE